MPDSQRLPASTRIVETDWPVKTAKADWSTGPAMLGYLRKHGASAWQAKISQQMTRAEIQGLPSEQIDAARKAGRLDRLLADGK